MPEYADISTTIPYAIAIIALIAVAFFSVAEKGTLNLIDKKDEYEKIFETVDIEDIFSTILVFKISAIIVAAMAALAVILINSLDWTQIVLTVILMLTPSLLALGLNGKWCEKTAIVSVPFFQMFCRVNRRYHPYSKSLEARLAEPEENMDTEDLTRAFDSTVQRSHISENNMLKGIVRMGNKTVVEIMTPRIDVVSIDKKSTFETVRSVIREERFSRIPVYEDETEDIVGILYIKDLLPILNEEKEHENWTHVIRQPFFVPENKTIDDLFQEFQNNKVHIAIVVDEYGSMIGIVTMEDILEEIVGEINDEFDEDRKIFVRLEENKYIFEGKTPINTFCEFFNLNEDDVEKVSNESETLAGFILSLCNSFPKVHQVVLWEDLILEILQIKNRRISKIKIVRTPAA